MVKEISVAELQERFLALLDELDEEGLVITKDGLPVALLLPVRGDGRELIGSLAGKIEVKGDIESTGVAWAV